MNTPGAPFRNISEKKKQGAVHRTVGKIKPMPEKRTRRRRSGGRPLLRLAAVGLAALAMVASLASLAAHGVRSIPGSFDGDGGGGGDGGISLGGPSPNVLSIGRRLHSSSSSAAAAATASRRVDAVAADGPENDGEEHEGGAQAAVPRDFRPPSTSEEAEDADASDVDCGPSARMTPPRPYYVSLPVLTFGCLYMFLALAIVCDDCFVPALEVLSDRFGLSDDVAGATLMAAGGSAPELFTALVGTFQREAAEGIAVGTILGSAVFNVLFVIGACAFAIPRDRDLRLHPYPLLRDCSCYVIGLGSLATFAGVTSPGVVEPWEAAVMFGLYCSYVAFMAYGNRRTEAWFKNTFERKHQIVAAIDYDGKGLKVSRRPSDLMQNVQELMDGNATSKGKYVELLTVHTDSPKAGTADKNEGSGNAGTPRMAAILDNGDASDKAPTDAFASEDAAVVKGGASFDDPEQPAGEASHQVADDDDDEDDGPLLDRLRCPSAGSSCFDYVSYLMQLPLVALLGLTIPDARPREEDDDDDNANADKAQQRRGSNASGGCSGCRAYAAFFLSISWIGAFTYAMVRCAEFIGAALEIPNAVMGLTVLATGASVPDMLSAICVARKGRGDMAVSCTVGSNIFDLLLGLPVPWLLSFALPGYPDFVRIGTDDMVVSILVLVGMLFATVAVMKCLRWRMGRGLGMAMFAMYLVFLAQAVMRELPFDSCTG